MKFFLAALGLSVAIIGGALVASAQAQKPEDLPPPISVDVRVVNVLATVRDKRGGLIPSLTKDDFEVYEDGKLQSIKYFARETDLPLTIGMLVDTSGSQEALIETERNAASQFFSRVLRKKDLAFLISFGKDSELLQDLTGSPRLLQEGLNRLRLNAAVGGIHPGPVPTAGQQAGTVLYDAVYLAADERLKTETGRKAMILITDGEDVGSKLSKERAIEAAQKANAVIYSIYYVDHQFGMRHGGGMVFGGNGNEGVLRRMSDETGGHVYRVDRKHTLMQIFDELQEEMRSQYAIGYTPTNPALDGGYRKLEIRAKNKDMKVQTRKGYYATREN